MFCELVSATTLVGTLTNVAYKMHQFGSLKMFFRWVLFWCKLLQVANHLDRAVSSLGRHPLKVLVQVNTSGEACEYFLLPTGLQLCKVDFFSLASYSG